MSDKIPKLGDVVYVCNNYKTNYIVMGVTNNEDMGSCSYDRDYLLLPEILASKQDITMRDLRVVPVRGVRIDDTLILVEGAIPYRVTKQTIYQVEQKKPRTITIYE